MSSQTLRIGIGTTLPCTEEKEDWMLAHEYARGALKLVFSMRKALNPFKFG